jgi:trk system potassium uptake protein TrkA
MNVIVIGCGRVGSALSTILSTDGHNVTIIDESESSFEVLPKSFNGKKIVGIGFDVDVLEEAGIQIADAVAVVTPQDNINIMCAETIRSVFGVQNVVARIFAPRKKKTFERLNLRSVCPTTTGAYQLYSEMLAARINSSLPLNNGDFQLMEIPLESVAIDKINEYELETGCKVVGAKTKSRIIFPWINQPLADQVSWIILAPTSHLRSIVDSIEGGV